MTTVIPVKFAYAARDLWFDPQGSGAQEGDGSFDRISQRT